MVRNSPCPFTQRYTNRGPRLLQQGHCGVSGRRASRVRPGWLVLVRNPVALRDHHGSRGAGLGEQPGLSNVPKPDSTCRRECRLSPALRRGRITW